MQHDAMSQISDTCPTVRPTVPSLLTLCLILVPLLVLGGCASPSSGFLPGQDGGPRKPVNVSDIRNPVPHVEPLSKSGNPRSYVVAGRRYYVLKSSKGYVRRGIASWYGRKFHGRLTASGQPYDMYAMTAANRTLPLPTYVWVTNLRNGRRVIVKVNDRGPFADNRLIDLSYAAAKKLGIVATGTAPVEVRAIDPRAYQRRLHERRAARATPSPNRRHTQTERQGVYIQVGAFADFRHAERMLKRLDGRFHSVQISTGKDAQKNRIYRVRIGPMRDHAATDRAAHALAQIGVQYTLVSLE